MDSGRSFGGIEIPTSWQMVQGDGLPLFAVGYRGPQPALVVFKSRALINQLSSEGLKVSESLQKDLGLSNAMFISSRVNTSEKFIKALFDAFVHHRSDHGELKYHAITFVPTTAKDALKED